MEFKKRKELFEFDNPDYNAPWKEIQTGEKRKAVITIGSPPQPFSPVSSQSSDSEQDKPATPSIPVPPIKPREGKYDWRGLRNRKKATRRKEMQRQKAKEAPASAEPVSDSENYKPIAAKVAAASKMTLVPLSRAPRPAGQDFSRASFWDNPAYAGGRLGVTYGKKRPLKPFFVPRNTKARYECGYCKSLGHTGSRVNHPENECRTRMRDERTSQSNEAQGKRSNAAGQQLNNVIVARPFPLVTFTKPKTKASMRGPARLQPLSQSSLSEEGEVSEVEHEQKEAKSREESISEGSSRNEPSDEVDFDQVMPIVPDVVTSWQEALTGGHMFDNDPANLASSPDDLLDFEALLTAGDDFPLELPSHLSGHQLELLNAMLESQSACGGQD